MTREQLRRQVADALELAPEQVADDDNLIALGLTSMALMRMANGWRRDGLPVAFAALVPEPTVEAWWRHLDGLQHERAEAAR